MACYLYYINKFVEFADTFFFIARKKFRNVNKLQLIHHGIMPIYGFMIARWLPGGHETFGGMFNCFVHVIMYGYYFLGKYHKVSRFIFKILIRKSPKSPLSVAFWNRSINFTIFLPEP